jgi:hypothetical protein
MNALAPLLNVLILFAGPQAGAGTPVRPAAPILPAETASADRAALTQASALLSKGLFDLAGTQVGPLTPAPVTHVWVDWTPVPKALRPGYKQAVQLAIHEWNAGLAPGMRFDAATREEDADLLVLFDRAVAELKFGQPRLLCTDTQVDPTGSHRTGAIRIALNVPNTEGPHLSASVTHLVSQGLGAFLGLGPSANAASIMGPDVHAGATVTKIADADLRAAKQLVDARMKLADYAKRKVAIYLPKAKLTAEKTEIDAGDVWRGENAHYVFLVKNTGDAPLEIDAKPNCGCTVANFDKVIAPGSQGKIEADVHTTNFRGKVMKVIDVTSNDLDNPRMSLHLVANIKSIITIAPSESPLIGLKSDAPTTQELEIKIADKEPVQVTRVTCSAAYASAKVDPMPAENGTAYKVTLTIDPAAPMGRSAFIVSAFTTSKREPQVNITAICEKGIVVMPPSAYMGTIGPRAVLPLNQFITISRREGRVNIQKIDNDDPKLEIQQVTMKEGQQYQLHLTYRGGWPTGLIQRKIVIHTDDPAQPRIEIPVMANVTGAAPAVANPVK